MPRGPALRKADLDRVLKALKDAGCVVERVEVRPGGEVVVYPALTGTASKGEVSSLDAWRARRGDSAAKGS